MKHPRKPLRGNMWRAALLAATFLQAPSLPAQEQAEDLVRRALIERQQQSDAFSLQLRQSQQSLNLPPGIRLEVEREQLQRRRDFENLTAQQLNELEAAPGSSRSWGPHLDGAPQRMQQERNTAIDRALQRP